MADLEKTVREWMTCREVAELAGVSIDTIKAWVKRGVIPSPLKVTKRTHRYDKSAVLKALSGMEEERS